MPKRKTSRWAWETAAVWLLSVAAGVQTPASSLAGGRTTPQSPVKVIRKGNTLTVTLAPALQRAVSRHFPGFRLARFDDYNADDKGEPQAIVPFACVGDFDGNGLTDAALLLTNRHHQWRLVAFHQIWKGFFRPYRIGNREGFPEDYTSDATGISRFYLLRRRPGRVRYPPSSYPPGLGVLHLRHDAILGEWSEEASRIFYFRRGRYRYVQQGD
jgi:hypothetical protein